MERFARSAGFGESALEDAVKLAEKTTDKLTLSGRSRKNLAAAILYIVSCLHPDCEKLTQGDVGDICNVSEVSIRSNLNLLCEDLERDDLSFALCSSSMRCSDAVAEAFLTPKEIANVVRKGPIKWPKEKVIRDLQDLADELGRAPKVSDNRALYAAARKHFSSWSVAKKEAGVEPPEEEKGREWTKGKVIQELQNLANRLGRSPRIEGDQELASAAISCFASWDKAKEEAGLEASAPSESVKGD